MGKYTIVVVGPGLIGKKHLTIVAESKDAILVAIVAPNTVENNKIAKENHVDLYEDIELCLKKTKPDGVIIASPNEFHIAQALICIQHNIPVLIEKPIATNLIDAEFFCTEATKIRAKVLIGHHRTYSSMVLGAKKIIQEKKLGELVSITGSAQFYKPESYFLDAPWRKESGGVPILINLIHEIGLLRTFCGEIEGVQALSSSRIRNNPVEETVAINILFESGVLGTFLLSDVSASVRSWELTSGENPVYPHYDKEDCYEISGTLGTLSMPTMSVKYYKSVADASWHKSFIEECCKQTKVDPLIAQFEHFINVIRGAELPIVSASEGFSNLKVINAIQMSIAEKKLIKIR
jgi:predicted dehydrogenase